MSHVWHPLAYLGILAVGYVCVLVIALVKCPKGERAKFIGENGMEAASLSLAMAVGAFFLSLFIAGGLCFLGDVFFQVKLAETDRYMLHIGTYSICYICGLAYGLWKC
jgi:hypothetical protein